LVAIFGLFGDVACHVIDVGTCCPNLHNLAWAGSSVVKHRLIVTVKVECLNPQKDNLFCTKLNIKLALVESIWTIGGVLE
jgi:cytochrome c551/c552